MFEQMEVGAGAGEAITSYQLSLNTLVVYKCLQRSVWIFDVTIVWILPGRANCLDHTT